MTTVINLIGAPGTGKSTIAAELFSRMKWEGYDVELVSEYAKDLVWEQRHETFKNQLYIFAKQQHRLFRLSKRVQYIITDCPLVLSDFYNKEYGSGSKAFSELVKEQIDSFNNLNFLLQRTKPYVSKGRNQTEEEANAFYPKIKDLLIDLKIDFEELRGIKTVTANTILQRIKDEARRTNPSI